jgi:hypothetical protein
MPLFNPVAEEVGLLCRGVLHTPIEDHRTNPKQNDEIYQ